MDDYAPKFEQEEHHDAGNGKVGSSVLDRIRQRRIELQKERFLDKEIPGYSGMLLVRLKPVSWDTLKKIAKKADRMRNNPRVELIGQTDTILAATEMILARDDEGNVKPLHEFPEVNTDTPIKFDQELAKVLGIDAQSARNVLWRVFNNDYAITTFHNEFMEWQREADEEVDDDLVGESVGTPQ